MLGKKKKSSEESEEQKMPKLMRHHFEQITKLVKQYGSVNKVLAHWGAVNLDENGMVISVLDYSEASEYEQAKYEKREPLKEIFYTGHGFHTYIPYNWCTEWMRQWEWWVTQNPNHPDLQGMIGKYKSFSEMRAKASNIGSL